jgi:cyanophycin synthetase
VIYLDKKVRSFAGVAYGLNYPLLLVRLFVDKNRLRDVEAYSARVNALLGFESVVYETPDTEQTLVDLILEWLGGLYRLAHVPIFETGKLWLTGEKDRPMEIMVALPCLEAKATLRGLQWILGWMNSDGDDNAREAELERVLADLRAMCPVGINTYYFIQAAVMDGVPFRRLFHDVFRFGCGSKGVLMSSSITAHTPSLALSLSKDKFVTAKLLGMQGLPVPVHQLVNSGDRAVAAANAIGYPVVVKPADLDQGVGVAAGLLVDQEVSAAYERARARSKRVLVEKYVPGDDYRVTVFRGRILKTVLRRPGGVLGDGEQSITDLVKARQVDPEHVRRAKERGHGGLLSLDQEALELLAGQGLHPQSVPDSGQFVRLRRNANVSTGGTPSLYEGPVHSDNRRLIIRAAAALQLDLAGVDLIIPDIAKSWLEGGAIVCEVNGCPQIGAGSTPDIYREILSELVADNGNMRLVLVIGSVQNGLHDQLQRAVTTMDKRLGFASSQGVWLGAEQIAVGQTSGFDSAAVLLGQEDADAGVIYLSAAEILRTGLPFGRCDLVVLDNVGENGKYPLSAIREVLRMVLPHVTQGVMAREGDSGLVGLEAISPVEVIRVTAGDQYAQTTLLKPVLDKMKRVFND